MAKSSDAKACATLRERLLPGTTVYTCLRYRSSDGMTRRFTLHIIAEDHRGRPEIRDITYRAAQAVGFHFDNEYEAIRIRGCGMDMGYHVVYSLGRVLYPEGFKLAEGQHGRNGDTSGFDTDGGYALEHQHI